MAERELSNSSRADERRVEQFRDRNQVHYVTLSPNKRGDKYRQGFRSHEDSTSFD